MKLTKILHPINYLSSTIAVQYNRQLRSTALKEQYFSVNDPQHRASLHLLGSHPGLLLQQEPYQYLHVVILLRKIWVVLAGQTSTKKQVDHSSLKLKLRLSKGMLLVKIKSSNKNLMAEKKQMAPQSMAVRKWWWGQRLSGFGVRFRSWNVGSSCRRRTEACEKLRKRKLDVCCNQEVKWREHCARFLS